MARFISG